MLHYLYEQILTRQVLRGPLPRCIALILNSGDLDERGLHRIEDFIGWSEMLGLSSLIIYINEGASDFQKKIITFLSNSSEDVSVHTEEGVKRLGSKGGIKIVVSLGFGGKHEVTEAFRKLLKEVEDYRLDPEEIDETIIEKHLRFSQKPDMIIRAGARQLSDFMIWQAAYSELYFTQVNWSSFRKIDLLRAIRDCEKRDRRFGR
jgi:undecaprenyl diphosphate synthase